MKKALIAALMVFSLAFTFAIQAAFAQPAGGAPGQMPTVRPPSVEIPTKGESPPMALPRASEIINLAVTNLQQHDLGKVKDLIVGSGGRISYLIVSKGGVMGIGDTLYAIPWQAANPKIHQRALVVSISKEQFEGAPSFASWEDFKTGGYESNVRAYYGARPGSEGAPREPMEKTPDEPSSN